MRFLFALILCVMIGAPALAAENANSGAGSKFTGELLNFEQLIRLPKERRMQYLRDMVDLLATMEKFNNQYITAEVDQMRQLREQYAQMIQMFELMPAAHADGEVVDLRNIVPVRKDGKWDCGTAAEYDSWVGACLVFNKKGSKRFTPSSYAQKKPGFLGRIAGAISRAPEYCPEGTHEIPRFENGNAACVPDANWAQFSEKRKEETAKQAFLDRDYRLARDQALEQQDKLNAATGSQTKSNSASTRDITTDPATPAAEKKPDANAAVTPPPTRPIAAEVTPAAPSDQCKPAIQECKSLSGQKRKEAIANFRRTKEFKGRDANVCIAGGFASKYTTSRKTRGTCEIKRSFSSSPGVRTKPCEPNQALCNPVLFCLGGRDVANNANFVPVSICVDRKPGEDKKNLPLTSACAEKYKSILEGKQPMLTDCKVDPKLTGKAKSEAEKKCAERRETKAVECDPEYVPGGAAKAIWDDLVQETKKLRDVWCGWEEFTALFCRECQIVNDKIYYMNKKATGSGCIQSAARDVPAGKTETTK